MYILHKMIKIKNKFIIFIILLFVSIIWYLWISSYFQEKVDRSSYATLIEGNAIINNKPLKLDFKTKLLDLDNIRTIWANSIVIIEWWEWSVTRLWGNSEIFIKETFVNDDLSKINIWFELLSWKTWSNVISFLWEWSYFKEYFRDTEAAVRWTIFDLNLDSEYIYVTSHKVDLKNSSWENYVITENNPFSLNTFSFIDLEKFIKDIKDKSWESLNKTLDSQLFQKLRDNAYIDLENLMVSSQIDVDSVLNNIEEKKELYNKVLYNYQKINFVKSDSPELFQRKLELKETLYILASKENKENIIKNTLYDLSDVLKNDNYSFNDEIINILAKDYGLILDITVQNYIWNINLPTYIEESLKEKYDTLYNIFNPEENIVDLTIEANKKAEWYIHSFLNSILEKFINLFK